MGEAQLERQTRLSSPWPWLGAAYFGLVTGVTLWVSLVWLHSADEPTFSGIWLIVVAPQAAVPLWFVPGLDDLSGQPYLLTFFLTFVVEFLLVALPVSTSFRRGLRRRLGRTGDGDGDGG